jgi:excisionase family DNA binding protein
MNSHENHVKDAEASLKEPMEPEWVSYPEAERYCGLSHTTLWRYVKTGEIKAARVGRSVRLHLPSLREFMEGRTTDEGDTATKAREPI